MLLTFFQPGNIASNDICYWHIGQAASPSVPPHVIKKMMRNFVKKYPKFCGEMLANFIGQKTPEAWIDDTTKPGEMPETAHLLLACFVTRTTAAALASGRPQRLDQTVWKTCPQYPFEEHQALFMIRGTGWHCLKVVTERLVSKRQKVNGTKCLNRCIESLK